MNNYGCSLIWGHPQGPTGLRSVIELIEELVIRGGGRGLFQGCAAGDTRDGGGHRGRPAQTLNGRVFQAHQRLRRYASMHSADALA